MSSANEVLQQAKLAGGYSLAYPPRNMRAGTDRFETADRPAIALNAVGLHYRLPALAGSVANAMIKFAVQHQAAADTGRDRDVEYTLTSFPGAEHIFANSRSIRIIIKTNS